METQKPMTFERRPSQRYPRRKQTTFDPEIVSKPAIAKVDVHRTEPLVLDEGQRAVLSPEKLHRKTSSSSSGFSTVMDNEVDYLKWVSNTKPVEKSLEVKERPVVNTEVRGSSSTSSGCSPDLATMGGTSSPSELSQGKAGDEEDFNDFSQGRHSSTSPDSGYDQGPSGKR